MKIGDDIPSSENIQYLRGRDNFGSAYPERVGTGGGSAGVVEDKQDAGMIQTEVRRRDV